MSHQSFHRNKHVVRVLTMLSLLRAQRMSIRQLSLELGVSTRTVRRDIDAMEEAHVPLYQDYIDGQIAPVWGLMQGRVPDVNHGGAR